MNFRLYSAILFLLCFSYRPILNAADLDKADTKKDAYLKAVKNKESNKKMRLGPYDEQYYYVFEDKRARKGDEDEKPIFIGLSAKNEWSAENNSWFTANPNQLLKFAADNLELRIKDNHPGEIGDLNMDSSGLLVQPWVYKQLRFFNIRGVQWMHAVYYDIHDVIHEPMHFMKFYEMKDYWSRERSTLILPFDENDPDDRAEIDVLSLDEKKLREIPEEERLAFVLKAGTPTIIFHARIAEPLIKKGVKGVRFFKVSEYESGMEHQ